MSGNRNKAREKILKEIRFTGIAISPREADWRKEQRNKIKGEILSELNKEPERLDALRKIAKNYGFVNEKEFVHNIESAIVAYRLVKYGREAPSKTVKRLQRQANGGKTKKTGSLLEVLSSELEMLRGAGDPQEAASRAADNLKGGTRGRGAQGVLIERILAIWYATHGVPGLVSGWEEVTELKGPFIDFLNEVADCYGVVWEKTPRPSEPDPNEPPPWQTIENCLNVLKDRVRVQDSDS